MSKFGYIITDNNTIINVFRTESISAKEFELIFNVQLVNYAKLELIRIEINRSVIRKISERIKYYLSIRNEENPDYNIDWKGRFQKNMMFIEEFVLGEKMELFQGNEDLIIAFLARIDNHLKNDSNGLYFFHADNHKEQRNFLENRLA